MNKPLLRWWTDVSCAVFHVNDNLFLLLLSRLADGRRADVRCCARGGRGCAAVSADHCQLITVQPTQALALWEPLHGPHQRGRCFSTCYLLCLLSQHTEHRHTKHISSQGSRRRLNYYYRLLILVFMYMKYMFIVCVHIQYIPKRSVAILSLLSEFHPKSPMQKQKHIIYIFGNCLTVSYIC